MSVNLLLLGTAGVELSCDGQVILIDPYLSRPGKKDIVLNALIPKREAIERDIAEVVYFSDILPWRR